MSRQGSATGARYQGDTKGHGKRFPSGEQHRHRPTLTALSCSSPQHPVAGSAQPKSGHGCVRVHGRAQEVWLHQCVPAPPPPWASPLPSLCTSTALATEHKAEKLWSRKRSDIQSTGNRQVSRNPVRRHRLSTLAISQVG